VRRRFAVVRSGMMGGGFSEVDAADATWGVVVMAAVVAVKSAVCSKFLLFLDCNEEEEVLSSDDEVDDDACSAT